MNAAQQKRRRSPGWVRQSTQETLHALVGRFARARVEDGLTERQEALWDALISELEYRWRSKAWATCPCVYCRPRWLQAGPLLDEEL